jgi:hypothetical protein
MTPVSGTENRRGGPASACATPLNGAARSGWLHHSAGHHPDTVSFGAWLTRQQWAAAAEREQRSARRRGGNQCRIRQRSPCRPRLVAGRRPLSSNGTSADRCVGGPLVSRTPSWVGCRQAHNLLAAHTRSTRCLRSDTHGRRRGAESRQPDPHSPVELAGQGLEGAEGRGGAIPGPSVPFRGPRAGFCPVAARGDGLSHRRRPGPGAPRAPGR